MNNFLTINASGGKGVGKTLVLTAVSELVKKAGFSVAWNAAQQLGSEEITISGNPKTLAETIHRSGKSTEANFADALDAFWNASLTAVSAEDTPTAYAAVGAVAEGFAAVAAELRASRPAPKVDHELAEHIKALIRNAGLPVGHSVIEQTELHDGSDCVVQTVVIAASQVEYQRIIHTDEAYGV